MTSLDNPCIGADPYNGEPYDVLKPQTDTTELANQGQRVLLYHELFGAGLSCAKLWVAPKGVVYPGWVVGLITDPPQSYFVIIGRVPDGENETRTYKTVTVQEAAKQFIRELQEDLDPEDKDSFEYESQIIIEAWVQSSTQLMTHENSCDHIDMERALAEVEAERLAKT